MNKKFKELAEQAGYDIKDNCPMGREFDIFDIEHFAQLVRQDERETCAKLCDDLAGQVGNKNFIAVDQRKFCAKQIRAKGNYEQT